jgi:hypothetical protein
MPRARWWTAAGFAAGAAAALAGAYAVSEALDPVYGEMAARMEIFHARAPRVQAISVGNSHSRALDFAALGMDGVHFWEGGEDAFEAVYLARYTARRAPRLKYVLFTASYGVERLDHAYVTRKDVTGLRRQIYARTSGARFIPGDGPLWLSARFAPIARPDHWHGVITRLHRPPRTIRMTPDGVVYEAPRPPLSPDSLVAHATRRAAYQDSLGDETVQNDSTTPTRALAGMETLARELQEKGVTLVLYTPPYHEAFLRQLAPGTADGTRRALAPLLRHPNVVWMDFAEHPDFSGRADLYRDSDHMNAQGARAFSALLGRCVAALASDAGPGPDCRTVAAEPPRR